MRDYAVNFDRFDLNQDISCYNPFLPVLGLGSTSYYFREIQQRYIKEAQALKDKIKSLEIENEELKAELNRFIIANKLKKGKQ